MTNVERLPTRLVRRGGWQPRAIGIITIAWCLMWDKLSWGNLANGFLVGLAATLIFPLPSIEYHGRPRPLAMIALLLRFMWDLVKAAVHVSWLAIRPRPAPRGSIVEVQLRTRSDLYITLVGALVALVPGSVVVEVRRAAGILYVHDVDTPGSEGVEACRARVLDIEERLVKAIGTRHEIALIEEAKSQ
ncbi:Na+/H+ antiporter subunit E [Blastococcus sp. Marseille-P5729]|uniref:Na+/H+ antiporter subunit E n=1 Tax=Blastococcus sp. Marseille-P5729 TaxID=2086582 RepID=UPI000D107C50|nr:Na+/H+ antiporter subunit E [Blastococcus sp. Marseille-P5729]